ncbi:MAG: NAD-dependent epimerase/dehydratase family protein [Flavobacteriaceae bacterium]
MKIAVTGTTGFIGSTLAEHLRALGHEVVPIARGDVSPGSFKGCRATIHCAAIAHSKATPAEYEAANHGLAVDTARASREAGAARFVFVSTIGVIADNKPPLTPDMAYAPNGEYAAAKMRAEIDILKMPDAVAVRPPLVVGANAPGSLALLRKLCDTGLPLPFASVRNRRSVIDVNNLAALLARLATGEDKRTGIIHAVDPEPLSLPQIIRAMRPKARLIPFPPSLLTLPLKLAGKGKMADQLFGNLVVEDQSPSTTSV